MTNLKSRLSILESRLQTLVEGGAARMIPFLQADDELLNRLVESFEAGTQPDADGTLIAPDLFTLVVHPDQISLLLENQILLDKLIQTVQHRGIEMGVRFISAPTIKVTGDPDIVSHQVKILAQISPSAIEKTNALSVELELNDELESVPSGAFLIIDGKQTFPLHHRVLNIGRRVDNHLVMNDPRVSRLHAQLRAIKGRFVLFDLDSAGGTFVNKKRIQQYILHPGDVISLAGVTLVFGQESSKAVCPTQAVQTAMGESS